MTSIKPTIASNSDQLNADDLLGGGITIKITKVIVKIGSEQPVALHYEGDEGKPWRPCLSMRRVIAAIWGDQSTEYTGKSITIYRDANVTWAGAKVGGIRISHMSGMDKPETLALAASSKSKKPVTIQPLQIMESPQDKVTRLSKAVIVAIQSVNDAGGLNDLWSLEYANDLKEIETLSMNAFAHVKNKFQERLAQVAPEQTVSVTDEEIPL